MCPAKRKLNEEKSKHAAGLPQQNGFKLVLHKRVHSKA
jgi:hypothetical protein